MVLRDVFYDKQLFTKSIVDEYTQAASCPDFVRTLVGLAREYFSRELDMREDHYEAFQPRLLLVRGERDRWLPVSFGRRLTDRIVGARLRVLVNAARMPHQECGDQVNVWICIFSRAREGIIPVKESYEQPRSGDTMSKRISGPVEWLLQGPAFVRYRTLADLLGKSETDREVRAAHKQMVEDPLVEKLISEVNAWERQRPITRHNDAVHPLHKLVFAADIGVDKKRLRPAIEGVLAHQSADGPFQVRIQIPKAFGGDGVAKWDWVATDAPLVLFALLRLGVRNKRVMRGVDHIRSRITGPGFPCFASSSMGKFKGPGRKADPCPYANLIILRMLAEVPSLIDSPEAKLAIAMLLHHWEVRGKHKYFLFGIGTDFAKPKAPLIWYDIVHYVDTLTRFPIARKDRRLHEVAQLLASTADSDGRITSRSIWTKWKGWEFCQKKEPSYWLTFLYHRAMERMEKEK